MSRLDVVTLGQLEVRPGRRTRPLRFAARKIAGLFAYLVMHAGIPHRRDHLASLFWSGRSPREARHNLRQTLNGLRTILAPTHPDVIQATHDTITLVADRVHLDVAVFERMIQRGTLRTAAAACRKYQGEFLRGLELHEPRFDAWLRHQRIRLHELAIDAHQRCIQAHVAAGRTTEAIQFALGLLMLDPLQEDVHRTLIRLFGQRGHYGAALDQFADCIDILAREIDAWPSEETLHVWRRFSAGRTPRLRSSQVARSAGVEVVTAHDAHRRRKRPPLRRSDRGERKA